MKENYYIQAAIELGEIEDTTGYGCEDGQIILTDGSTLDISSAVDSRAQHLHNLNVVRTSRDSLITDTDWVGYSDIPDSDLKTALIAYRQELRDITSQVIEGEELDITWPIDPRL